MPGSTSIGKKTICLLHLFTFKWFRFSLIVPLLTEKKRKEKKRKEKKRKKKNEDTPSYQQLRLSSWKLSACVVRKGRFWHILKTTLISRQLEFFTGEQYSLCLTSDLWKGYEHYLLKRFSWTVSKMTSSITLKNFGVESIWASVRNDMIILYRWKM